MFVIDKTEINRLIELLRERGYKTVGPTIRGDAILYDEIASGSDLPVGWADQQEAGRYRLKRRGDDAYFGYVVGPYSCKRYFFPPELRMFAAERDGRGFRIAAPQADSPKIAFLGVRSCELAAVAVQDRVFLGQFSDPYYKGVRDQAFTVAVNCTEPGGTCFCASMGTGPQCRRGFDLALTELDSGFAVEVGSHPGQAVLDQLDHRQATAAERQLVRLLMERSTGRMGRHLNTDGLPDLLIKHPEHKQWNKVGERCLTCANCTLVCPTCFCASVEDRCDLSGEKSERVRLWGSCFMLEFSYTAAETVRTSNRARYRQWMGHKLAGWHEQFGASGCVGCGRCITWCPVGIDITAEAAAIRAAVESEAAAEATEVAPR